MYLFIVCVCIHMYAYVPTIMCTCKFSRELVQVGSFLLLCVFWGSSSDHQGWWSKLS